MLPTTVNATPVANTPAATLSAMRTRPLFSLMYLAIAAALIVRMLAISVRVGASAEPMALLIAPTALCILVSAEPNALAALALSVLMTMPSSSALAAISSRPAVPSAIIGKSCTPALPKSCIARAARTAGSGIAARAPTMALNRSSGVMPDSCAIERPRRANAAVASLLPLDASANVRLRLMTPLETSSSVAPFCSAANPSRPRASTLMPVFLDISSRADPAEPNATVAAIIPPAAAPPMAANLAPMPASSRPTSLTLVARPRIAELKAFVSAPTSTNTLPALTAPALMGLSSR